MRGNWCGGCGASRSYPSPWGLGFRMRRSLPKSASLPMQWWWEARLWKRLSGIGDRKRLLWENSWGGWLEVVSWRSKSPPCAKNAQGWGIQRFMDIADWRKKIDELDRRLV